MYSTVLVHHKIVILLLLLKYVRCASAQLSSKKTEKRNEQRTTTSRRSVMELRHGTHRRRGETDMYGCRRICVPTIYGVSPAWLQWIWREASWRPSLNCPRVGRNTCTNLGINTPAIDSMAQVADSIRVCRRKKGVHCKVPL